MKLEKKQKRILLFAVPILIGLYLIFKKPSAKTLPPLPQPTPTPSPSSTFEKYIVTTSSSSLNVRSEPSTTNSSIVSSLPKGSEIFARYSSIDGWYEYSKDGSKVDGYVSSQYITKK